MTCAEFRARLDGYVRDELPAGESAAFEAHLESCAGCEALVAEEAAPPGLDRLARAIEPREDLWPGIRRGITRPVPASRIVVPRWALAAAATILVALSSGITAFWLTSRRPVPVAGRDVRALEAQYTEASNDLSAALERARRSLAPETMARIEKNLAIIDAALAETRSALAKDPGNAALGQLVLVAWRQKVDLLRRAMALGTET